MLTLFNTLKRWWIEAVVLCLLATLVYLWISARHEAKVYAARADAAEKARDAALQQAALGSEAKDRADHLQATVDTLDSERKTLLAKVDALSDELKKRPMPPEPGDAPSEGSQVIADLKAMGTRPEELSPLKLAFPTSDGPTLWTWGKQALRVPGLESRIGALETFSSGVKLTLDKTTEQLQATEAQRNEFRTSSLHFETAYGAEVKNTDGLKLQVGEITAQRDSARKTRIYIGLGSFILGAWAEYKLTH